MRVVASSSAREGQEGYALVDVLVALAILSSILLLSVEGVGIASKASATAKETSAARTAFSWLLGEFPHPMAHVSGSTADFSWILRSSIEFAGGEVQLCKLRVELRSHRSQRVFVQETRRPCPAEATAAS